MVDARVASVLGHAAELERRDEAIAAELAVLADLAERAGTTRARGSEVRSELDRIPLALDELGGRVHEAEAAVAAARSEQELAEERLTALESGRRKRTEETERARREAATARDRVADAEAQRERLDARGDELRADELALRDEAAGLLRLAHEIARELGPLPRVAEAARGQPGETLAELEQWGALVRSALFVARGTLENEREAIVVEANALGAGALGESLGASSVALVRRRLETELAG